MDVGLLGILDLGGGIISLAVSIGRLAQIISISQIRVTAPGVPSPLSIFLLVRLTLVSW